MKVRIWKEQADQFEMSILSRHAELNPLSLEEMVNSQLSLINGQKGSVPGKGGEPLVLIGRGVKSEHVSHIRQLAAGVYRSSGTMLIIPPFSESDLENWLDTLVSLRLVRRGPDSVCKVLDPLWCNQLGSELAIRSDHVIETSLSAGILCVDAAGKAILLRYQPRNASGVAFISTIQLLSYSALSSEPDRQALITAILSWRAETPGVDLNLNIESEEVRLPDRKEVITTLLALAATNTTDIQVLQRITEEFLGDFLSKDRMQDVFDYLRSEGVLTNPGDGNQPAISIEKLNRAIEDLGIHAYARELQELIRLSSTDNH